ncbi:hypothetical protein ASZ90_020301 [hydrocarbon metagenome]|uniref:Outer membrane efflux protein n=1 Tax=hydrocarbon metagenome TaxID=938273 RepID=A0A0W8E128_9ZZZZ
MPVFRKSIILILTAFLLICFITPVLASDTDGFNDEGLTIEQAVTKALNYSKTLKQSVLDVEKSEEQRNAAADNVSFIPLEYSGYPEADRAYTGLLSADISWAMSKKTRDMNEDKITLSVFNAYVGVIQAGENVEYSREALINARLDWSIANTKYQLGMLSSVEKISANTQYQSAQNSLKLAEIELTTAYQALNKAIGLNIDERPILSEKPGYSEMGACDLEAIINKTVDGSPSIWLADKSVELAELQVKFYDWSTYNSGMYRATEISVQQASLSASESREQLRQSLRDIYYNILKLEESYQQQQEAVKLAQDSVRVKNLMFEVGLATKMEVQSAQLSLQQAQSSLDSIVFQHEYLKLVFEKPWAA